MSKMGRPTKGDRRKVTTPLDADIYQELKVYCAATGKEMGDVVAKSFVEWWETQLAARKAARELIEKSVPA